MNIFGSKSSILVEMFNLYRRIKCYDWAKLKKVGDFYMPTWLIFAGPVTYKLWIVSDGKYQSTGDTGYQGQYMTAL